MTKRLAFGTLGPTGYFTQYTSVEVLADQWSGWVQQAFDSSTTAVWYLDDDGKMVSEDAFSHVLKAIPMREFIHAADDDNAETDGQQWGIIVDWAENTNYTWVMAYDD